MDPDPLRQADIDALAYFGYAADSGQPGAAGWAEVPGVLEATAAVTFELDGEPVVIVGRHGQILGTLAAADSRIVKARPNFWRPLRLALAYGAEEKPSRR